MKNYSDVSILMDETMAKGCAYRGRSRENCLIRRVERLTEPRHRMVQSGTNDESWGNWTKALYVIIRVYSRRIDSRRVWSQVKHKYSWTKVHQMGMHGAGCCWNAIETAAIAGIVSLSGQLKNTRRERSVKFARTSSLRKRILSFKLYCVYVCRFIFFIARILV